MPTPRQRLIEFLASPDFPLQHGVAILGALSIAMDHKPEVLAAIGTQGWAALCELNTKRDDN